MSTPPESTLPLQPIHQNSNSESDPDGQSVSALDPDNPPWSLLQALLTWVASIMLLLLPQLLALPYLAAHYRGLRPTPEVLLADKTLVLIVVSGILPAHLITLILAWSVVTRLGKVSAKKVLGWDWKGGIGIWQSVGLAILLFGVAWLIAITLGGKETELERILESSRTAALIVAFLAVTTAPIVEESIYRGVLYPALKRTTGSITAVVIVSLMFAGPHVPQYWPNLAAISSITLLSLALTVVRARTRRLLPCVAIHLVFNGIQSLIIIFEPYLRALYHSWHPDAVGPGLINFLLGLSG